MILAKLPRRPDDWPLLPDESLELPRLEIEFPLASNLGFPAHSEGRPWEDVGVSMGKGGFHHGQDSMSRSRSSKYSR